MSFLSIPSQEGLFATIRTGKSAEEAGSRSHLDDGVRHDHEDDDDDNDDDDEDDDDNGEDVRLIPRCSPVPRKRGHSIYDETAEYMRIQVALPAGKKRVFFADTTGGDLVEVKEFVAFDSDDDEEESARWEEEEAKYRKQVREPSYRVRPEFDAPAGGALLRAVRSNKVEVEQMSPSENEPLAFGGVIRVLNVSFHKAVYIRSTMDNWASHYDHPAEYVQGSHDGTTDQFSFRLSFAPPYTTHGSRIEFVVRYETSEGDYWANNSSMNYGVTLLVSYEDEMAPTNNNTLQQVKGILRPPKVYSINDVFNSQDEPEKDDDEARPPGTGLRRPAGVCPTIVQPEIDIEIAVHRFGPRVPPNQELPSADGPPPAHTAPPGERFPPASPKTTLQTDSSFVLCATEPLQPNKSQPLPRPHWELGNQTPQVPVDASACAPLSASTPSWRRGPRPRSDGCRTGAEETPPSEASGSHLPPAEANLQPTTGEDHLCRVAGLSEGSTGSAAAGRRRCGEQHPPPPTPELSFGRDDEEEEEEDAPQSSPDTLLLSLLLLENPPDSSSEGSETRCEHDANLMPCVVFLGAVVCLSVALQEPGVLFIIGLLWVLHWF
ncbi:protein phosphatase 1 regulatory subunit 3A isoform X1 [Pungitius pungitius]|uniref:protein phosphatase 1 regulatory subunit 3A isoform X1 n=1 Tax=Pungitius pungitius TaxID=134920 RepID=UPI002E0FA85D